MRLFNYDVVVIGGGPAGIAAAISASKSCAKTILIEREGMFGGQATMSQVAAFCGFYTRGTHPDLVIGGVGELLLNKMKKYGFDIKPYPSKSTGNSNIKFDPEIMKVIFDELLVESGTELRLHTQFVKANAVNHQINSIICVDDDGELVIEGKQFIDTTGNGNLIQNLGLPIVWGDEYGNTQQASMVFKLSNLPSRDILNVEIENAIKQAKKDGIKNIFKEKGMIIKHEHDTIGYCTIPSVFVEHLNGETLTKAEINLRKQVLSYVDVIRKYIRGCENVKLVQSGPQLGVREGRRVIGEEILLGKDVLACVKRNDSIGRAAWSVELHKGDRAVEYKLLPDNEYASIPLGIIKARDCKNLWVGGRLVSTDSVAFGSLRVMGTSMVTGQAAGVAAALMTQRTSVSVVEIQSELIRQGVLI
ncbi:FAD-dependent oxidoreductase [uncultured Veillonella sp.]|uniref:FAD-dependent oxidoreductase n=1 Tax=uncultured Veillonella sp. TaxID=159268 RepID=UPI0026166698|nr:FAD-dependent oxidoreductase [uncultured Veillonella sp.]